MSNVDEFKFSLLYIHGFVISVFAIFSNNFYPNFRANHANINQNRGESYGIPFLIPMFYKNDKRYDFYSTLQALKHKTEVVS